MQLKRQTASRMFYYSLWEHHWDSWMRCCWCCLLIRCSPRWVPHRCSGGAVSWRGPWGLRLQCPSDRWVHVNDHRLHYGGHLCPIYAASVPHGLSVAFYTLPSSAGRWRFLWWHIPPKVRHIYTQKDFSAYKPSGSQRLMILMRLQWL